MGVLLHFTQGNLTNFHFYKFFSLLACHKPSPSITKAGTFKQKFSVLCKTVTSYLQDYPSSNLHLMKIPQFTDSKRKDIVDPRFIWTWWSLKSQGTKGSMGHTGKGEGSQHAHHLSKQCLKPQFLTWRKHCVSFKNHPINTVWGSHNHLFWESYETQNIFSLKYTDFESWSWRYKKGTTVPHGLIPEVAAWTRELQIISHLWWRFSLWMFVLLHLWISYSSTNIIFMYKTVRGKVFEKLIFQSQTVMKLPSWLVLNLRGH